MDHVIEGRELHKTFVKKRAIHELVRNPLERAQRIEALCGVDIAIREGEIFGLLGPNGAGKTTLIKIFCCLVLPDSGRATVRGVDTLDENRVKRHIGLVNSDERSFYWRLSARQNLRFFARLYDVPSKRIKARIDELLGRFDLTAAADRPFSGYSSGMKQRLAIARALLHDPPILFMDEPTRSLDPVASRALHDFMRHDLKQRDGKTIVLATHDLREAENVADRIAILVAGRVRQIGTVAEVRKWGVRERRFVLELEPSDRPIPGPCRTLEDRTQDGMRRAVVSLDNGAKLGELLAALVREGFQVRACDRVQPDLEHAFARILASEKENP